MKQSIQFPCVIVEKSNSYNRNTILNQFAVINNQIDLEIWKVFFTQPAITQNQSVIKEAFIINDLFNADCIS